MKIIRKSELAGTARHITSKAYETTRFLLEADQAGASVTDIVLAPGIEETYGYDGHTEIAYCLEGEATLTNLPNGTSWPISPGTMWVASPGERFRFLAHRPVRLICIFTPPLNGTETGFAVDMAKPV